MSLAGGVFAISGTLSMPRAKFFKHIEKHKGKTAKSITKAVTHLITTSSEFTSETTKVTEAKDKGIWIVNEDFIDACIEEEMLIELEGSEGQYLFGIEDASTGGKKKRQAEDTAPESKKSKKIKQVEKSAGGGGGSTFSAGSLSFNNQVDPRFGTGEAWTLLVDEHGNLCTALLVQKDVSKNMDKFYKVQAVSSQGEAYRVYICYGKTGSSGVVQQAASSDTPEEALAVFKEKFSSKTGWDWDQGLAGFKQKKGKYKVVLDPTAGQTAAAAGGGGGGGAVAAPPPPPPPGQKVIWQYYVDDYVDGKGPGWYPYFSDANQVMEDCYQNFAFNSWLDVRYVESGIFKYRVDFKAMTQTNVKHANHTTRKIRRHFETDPAAGCNTVFGGLKSMAAQAFGGLKSMAAQAVAAPAPAPAPAPVPAPAPAPAAKIDVVASPPPPGHKAPNVALYKAAAGGQPAFPDYAIAANCVLQVTNINNNNNKFYSLELHKGIGNCAKPFRLYTHYGRTDDLTTKGHDSGQKEIRYYDCLDDAKAGYLKIYKDKTSTKKGYKPVNLVSSKIGSAKARDQAAGTLGAATQAKMASPVSAPSINDGAKGKGKAKRRRKLQPEIAQLVQDLYAEAKDTLTSTADVTITANGIETPLGILSLEQVEEGENVLKEIAKELKKKRKSSKKLEELSGDFYTTIPTKIGRTKDQIKDAVIDTVAAVAEKQDLCQLMRDMLQVMATDAGALVGDGGVEAQYAALGCTLQPVPPESEEHRAVMERIEESVRRSHGQLDLLRGGGGGPVRAVYRARRAEEEARFTARVTKNQQLLFHGSRACNFVGLLSRGILLPKIVVSLGVTRTDGGWLGDGIYFGDFDTSLNYTSSSSKGIKYMLVNLVALGRMKDFSNITYGLQKPPKGYDSCHGNPEAEEGSEFEDHEYVVYQEDQQKVQYLLELNDEI